MEKDLAQQCSGLDSALTHPGGIALVNLGLEQAGVQRKQDFAEDGRPLLVIGRGELRGEEGPLQT